jgi:hypothetical protein
MIMRRTALILTLAAVTPSLGCQSARSRPPSDLAAVRKPTLWDHLLSDREDEREAIASRLKAEKHSLDGRKAGLMRSLRENELEAQLSGDESDRSRHEETITELSRHVDTNQGDLEWVAARQKQNSHDWRYWPDRGVYRKPVAPSATPIVETPERADVPQSSTR